MSNDQGRTQKVTEKKAQADALADSIVKLVQGVGKDELEYIGIYQRGL